MTKKRLSEMTDRELRGALRHCEAEHISNQACLLTVRECCERSGEALRDVQAEIERRKGNAQAARMVG